MRFFPWTTSPTSIEVTDFDGVDDYISIPSAGLWDVKSFRLAFSFQINSAYKIIMAARGSYNVGHSFTVVYDGATDNELEVYLGDTSGYRNIAAGLILVDLSSRSVGDNVDVVITYDGATFSVTVDDDTPVTNAYTKDMHMTTYPLVVGAIAGYYFDQPIWNVSIGTVSTVRGQYHNTTWEDQINSADGTIYGGPSLVTINP